MLIDINKVKVSDRIRKDFGNIKELADDIKENGLINPPVVNTDDYELIAGERRLRAMKTLGYKQIEVRPMSVKDAEHALNLEISENETRKDFSKSERIDYAKRLERIERLKAKENSLNNLKQNTERQNSDSRGRTDDVIADKLNYGSRDTYRKEKYIDENKSSLSLEDFAEWDEGKMSTNKAFNKIKKEKESLENRVKELESREPEIIEKEKIVDKTDHSLENKNKELQSKVKKLENEINDMKILNGVITSAKESTEQLMNTYKKNSDELVRLKNDMASLGLQPDGDYNVLELSNEITTLTNGIDELLTDKLSPMRYAKTMPVIQSNNALKRNMENLIHMVNDWCGSMSDAIGIEINDENIIDMEDVI